MKIYQVFVAKSTKEFYLGFYLEYQAHGRMRRISTRAGKYLNGIGEWFDG